MTKFKHILSILLIVVMCLSIAMVAMACKDNKPADSDTSDNTETTEKETLLVANGRFSEYTSSTSAPYAPTSWSGSAVDNTASTIAGVVPMDETKYKNMASAWDDLAYPGSNKEKAEENDYALMIYNKTVNGYSYATSSAFTTTVGSYYKFTVDYMVIAAGETPIVEGSGAFVTFSGAAYHRFGPYGVTNGWQTLTFYVAASELKSQSITITLSLGLTDNYTTGYAFFDDVLAESIDAAEYALNAKAPTDNKASYSMLVPDGDFVNVTGSSAVRTDAIWSGKNGSGQGVSANSNYVKQGVVVTDTDGWKAWKDLSDLEVDNVGTPYAKDSSLSSDKNILAISNQYALLNANKFDEAFTAYGFTNNTDMNIAPRTIYRLDVWVYTDLNDFDTVKTTLQNRTVLSDENTVATTNHGAYINLTGYGNYSFDNINTNKQWQRYTFYLLGSDESYKTVNLELWMGKGGMGDDTRASGTVYFDSISLTVLGTFSDRTESYNTYKAYEPTSNGTVLTVNMADTYAQLIDNSNFASQGESGYDLQNWTVERLNDIRESATDAEVKVLDTTANIENNPKAPYAFNPVLMIKHINPTATYMRNVTPIQVTQNLHYMVSIWVKTVDIDTDSGVTIALFDADSDSSLTSFTSVNTYGYKNEMPNVNGYAHYSFYIKGSTIADKTTPADNHNVYIKITFGSGNNFSTASYLSGTLYVASISMQQIDAAEYTAAESGTYTKTYSFASSSGSTSGSFADGGFNVITYDETKIDISNGNQTALYTPSSWTTPSVSNVESGILNIDQGYAATVKTATGITDDFYNGWDTGVTEDISGFDVDFASPNLFVAYTTAAVKAAKVLYNTSSVSLSNNSYYVIAAYVRAIGTVGEFELTTTGNSSSTVVSFGASGQGKWEEVVFAVETGSFGSVGVTLNLYLGAYSADKALEDKPTYNGAIFVDAVSCRSISKDKYGTLVATAAKNNGNGVTDNNFTTYTFDTDSTSTSTTTPSSSMWSGDGSSHDKVVGIYTNTYTNSELKYLETTIDDEEKTQKTPVEDKALTKTELFDTTGLTDGVTLGNAVLVINNQEAGFYTYRSASLTFASGKAYRISVWARTYNIAKGESALLRVTADDSYDIVVNSEYLYKVDDEGNYVFTEDGKHDYTTEAGAWHQYVFYIQNNKSSAQTAYLKLMVGQSATEAGTENSLPVQGTAVFDNVSMVEISENDFVAQYKKVYRLDSENKALTDDKGAELNAAGSGAYLLYNNAVRLEDDYTPDTNKDDNNDPTNPDDKPKTDSSLIWLYITSIVIAAMLIVVIVVWIINRNKKALKAFFAKLFKTKKTVAYSRVDETEGKGKKKEEATQDDSDDNVD